MSATRSRLVVAVEDGIAVVTLERPEARNELFHLSLTLDNRGEEMAAFVEKRPPAYRHR